MSTDLPAALVAEKTALVRKVYADLEARPVDRSCIRRTQCCRFRFTGKTPYLTRGEAIVAARAWRATGRKALPERKDGVCPILDESTGNCRIYEDRPFACRTDFCREAGGPYKRREVIDLIRRLEVIDVALEGKGALPITVAVARELR